MSCVALIEKLIIYPIALFMVEINIFSFFFNLWHNSELKCQLHLLVRLSNLSIWESVSLKKNYSNPNIAANGS